MQLDKIDRKILEILQHEGRIKNLELADRIGLSNTPCAKRVRRLEDNGVITGYGANISPAAVEQAISAFVLLQIGSNTRQAADRFAEEIAAISAVSECYMTTGTLDYLAKIHAKSLSHYESIVKDELGKIEDIVKAESLIVLNHIIPPRGVNVSET